MTSKGAAVAAFGAIRVEVSVARVTSPTEAVECPAIEGGQKFFPEAEIVRYPVWEGDDRVGVCLAYSQVVQTSDEASASRDDFANEDELSDKRF